MIFGVLVPRGSHILINHLWSCDSVEFIYDGAEASRVEKVKYIADDECVQENLRVCYKSSNEYNCGKCEKCIRTMASLEAINKLKNIKTFLNPLDADNIENIKLSNESELNFAKATMLVAKKNNKGELATKLQKQISNYEIN